MTRSAEQVGLNLLPVGVLFVGMTLLGMSDVAFQYFCGGSASRHGVMAVLSLSVLKGVIWTLFLTGVGCVICPCARLACGLLFVVPAFLVLLEGLAWLTFHMGLGGDWFTLAVTSSPSEMLEFFGSVPMLTWLLFVVSLAVMVGLAIIVCDVLRDLSRIRFRVRLCAGIVCLLLFALGKVSVVVGCDCAYPYFIPSTIANMCQYQAIRRCSNEILPYGFASVDENAELTAVFVIGESACRRNWSLYGYGRKTTPCVDSLPEKNKIAFADVQTPYPQTAVALRYLLTDADVGSNEVSFAFPAVLKHCGFKSSFISNQGHWHGIEGYESMLFALCDSKVYVADMNLPKPVYDDAVIPLVDKALSKGGRQAIFVHLEGSHMPMDIRCPKGQESLDVATLMPEDARLPEEVRRTLNGYDNSIAFTDRVLGALIAKLDAIDRPSFLFYVSDHGESPRSGAWRNLQDRDCWEVPMFVWFSDQYAEAYPRIVDAMRRSADRSLQMDTLLYGLVELCGLTGDYPGEKSFLSENFESSPRVVEFGGGTGML